MNTDCDRHSVPRGSAIPTLTESLVVLCLCSVIMLLAFRMIQAFEPGVTGLIGGWRFTVGLLIELLALGLPLGFFLYFRRYNLSRSLGLSACGFSPLAGAGLMGAGTVLFAPQLEVWLAGLVPPPEGYFEALVDFFTLKGGESLVWALFCLALAPALLEEALFRGILLRSALRSMSRPLVIFGVGAAFALFHFDLWRAPVLCLIGMLITWIAVRTASLWPAVVFHFVHNSLSLILLNVGIPEERGWIEGTADAPLPLLALGAFLLISGAMIPPQRAPEKTGPRKP